MANSIIQSGELGREVAKILDEYKNATIDVMKSAVDKVSKEAVKELKLESPNRTGAYASDWAQKSQPQTKHFAYAKVVFNKKHYRLTHLLEKGHLTVNGGKTRAFPHIAEVEQKAVDEFAKLIKEGV